MTEKQATTLLRFVEEEMGRIEIAGRAARKRVDRAVKEVRAAKKLLNRAKEAATMAQHELYIQGCNWRELKARAAKAKRSLAGYKAARTKKRKAVALALEGAIAINSTEKRKSRKRREALAPRRYVELEEG